MAVGLQIFDVSGNVVLDATFRVMRIIGWVSLDGSSGSRSDSRLAQGGFVSFQPAVTGGDGYLSGGIIVPRFAISGSTLTWSYPARNTGYDVIQTGILFYGGS
jgi:hypothetical protein